MGYRRADKILPAELVALIQQYVDGETIYIPRKEENRQPWGQGTRVREEMKKRDTAIYQEYQRGISQNTLAAKYYLSVKSIQRIIRKQKTEPNSTPCCPELRDRGTQDERSKTN